MKSKVSSLFLESLLVVFCLVASSAASCPGFRIGTTTCNSGIFSRSSIHASCSDDGEVAVTGTVTAPNAFDADAPVTFVPCMRGTGVCFPEYAQSGGSICDLIATTDESLDCGSAGQYTIDKEFDVPDEVSEHSWAMRFVTIKVLIDHQEACTQNATSNSSSAFFMASGMASLYAVGGLSMYFVRRKKRPLLVLEGDTLQRGEEDHVGKFVQMDDLSPSVSSIGNTGAYSVSAFV